MSGLSSHPPVVLSIAGSDPSGGAGIQADIKTISALGGYAAAVITAITSQNTMGVQGVYPLPPEEVSRQMASVLDDLHPTAVKIGMVHSLPIVEAIVAELKRYRPPQVVYDPVMISTSGRRLMTEETVEGICTQLFPRCTMITPNLDETSLLTGRRVDTPDDMEQAGRELAARYGCLVLVKGGHLEGDTLCDLLCSSTRVRTYRAPRTDSSNLHGTGCTLSSAIATLLAAGHTPEEAVEGAREYISRAIERGRDLHIGHGNGPLWHF